MAKLLLAFFFLIPVVTFATEVTTISDFQKFGIQAQVRKLHDPRLSKLEYAQDQYYLEVKLGRLSPAQYDAMRALYGNFSQVPYDAEREFDLVDFLLPAIQATVNQVFLPKTYDTSGLMDLDWEGLDEESVAVLWALQKSGVGAFSNCWNTTTQLLRLLNPASSIEKQKYFIYWPGRWEINEQLKNEELSSSVDAGATQFGDALLVSLKDEFGDGSMIQHTGLVLSDSLIFEKTDSTENDPYRISFRRDVLAKYKRIFPNGLVVDYRRYNQRGQKTFELPDASKISKSMSSPAYALLKRLTPSILDLNLTVGCETNFGGGCDPTYSEMSELKIVTNPKTGRGIFYGPRAVLDRFVPLAGK